jgi:hypothetical protein
LRLELQKIRGLRRRFQGKVGRFGTKTGYNGQPLSTLLLLEIIEVENRKLITDHVWFTLGRQFEQLNLKEGDVVRFDARVTSYEKRCKSEWDGDEEFAFETDYRLSNPTKCAVFSRA